LNLRPFGPEADYHNCILFNFHSITGINIAFQKPLPAYLFISKIYYHIFTTEAIF